MSRVLVDVGNTAIKWCVSTASGLGCVSRAGRSVDGLLASLADASVVPDQVTLCSVAGEALDSQLTDALMALGVGRVQFARSESRTGSLYNSYQDPSRMGADRWLAMLAAWQSLELPVCVVDVGTAVTIDLVSGTGRHEGGYILPGVPMMVAALERGTDRISVPASPAPSVSAGWSTAECVAHGAWMAIFGAVHTVLARAPEYRVVVTGGDGNALLTLGVNAEWRPQLVFEGLQWWERLQSPELKTPQLKSPG